MAVAPLRAEPPLAGVSALYGGSFDPPHVGHQMACLYLLQVLGARELWVVPTARHAFNKVLRPFAHRYAMVQKLAAGLRGKVIVSDIEAELGGVSTTLTTLKALKERFLHRSWAVVVGADVVPTLPRWSQAEVLFAEAQLVVLGRAGSDGEARTAQFPPRPWLFAGGPELPEVSSSTLRQRMAKGEDVAGWLPTQVLDYARAHKLYDSPLPA